MTMRKVRLACAAVLAISSIAFPAMAWAQDAAQAAQSGLDWGALKADDDWSITVLNGMFAAGTGDSKTAIGMVLSKLSQYVMLLGGFYLAYAGVLHTHKVGESGKVLSETFSAWVPVRIAFAVVLAMPLPQAGFSVGQELVLKGASVSVGMGRNLYNLAIAAVGPNAVPLSQPIIPGTSEIVSGLVANELCRDLVNLAGNNDALVPAPSFTTAGDGSTTVAWVGDASIASGAPLCGSVVLRSSPAHAGGTTTLGVSVDMTQAQLQALKAAIDAIRAPVAAIASRLWSTRQSAVLAGLRSVTVSASADYTRALQSAATDTVKALRDASSRSNVDGDPGMARMQALGWTSAGAYYLEIARLNGQMLSLMAGVPEVSPPNYGGIGGAIAQDLAPLVGAAEKYQAEIRAAAAATDADAVTGGSSALFPDARLPDEGSGRLASVLALCHINSASLLALMTSLSGPGAGTKDWTDPFAALIASGQMMIHMALVVLGMTIVLQSKVATGATILSEVATGNVVGAVATAGISSVIGAVTTPIFALVGALLLPGLFLAYVLPMMPFALWFAGVGGWMIMVCEAMVAVPFWMVAHLAFEGRGLHGKGIAGYSLIFNILFRPSLMMLGLLLAYGIFGAMTWLLMNSFNIAAGFVLTNGYVLTNLLGILTLIAMFVGLETQVAVMSFKLIATLPHHIPTYIGLTGGNRVDTEGVASETTGRFSQGPVRSLDLADKTAQRAVAPLARRKAITPPSPEDNGARGGIDSTLAAHFNVVGANPERED